MNNQNDSHDNPVCLTLSRRACQMLCIFAISLFGWVLWADDAKLAQRDGLIESLLQVTIMSGLTAVPLVFVWFAVLEAAASLKRKRNGEA